MLKQLGNILIAFVLMMSVMTPLIVDLLPSEEEIILHVDLEEEDQKESKKELEIKDLFFSEKEFEGTDQIKKGLISEAYRFKIVSFPLEVISPPPQV